MKRSINGQERRSFGETIELRAEDDALKLAGLAVPFDRRSVDLGGFFEVFKHGAFGDDAAVRGLDAFFLMNHDTGRVIGRTSASVELEQRKDGIYFEASISERMRPDVAAIEEGLVDKMSFGFTVKRDGVEWVDEGGDEDDEPEVVIREIHRAKLHEISAVPFPAYKDTDVSVAKRSLDEFLKQREASTTTVIDLARLNAQRQRQLRATL